MDTKVAYLAGLIDGDGCFTLTERPTGTHDPVLQIVMADERWVHEQFGGVYSADKPGSINKEQTFRWRITKKDDLLKLLPELLNFLINKRLAAIVVLEFCKKFRCKFGYSYSSQQREQMRRCADLLHALNAKGIGSNDIKETARKVIGLPSWDGGSP